MDDLLKEQIKSLRTQIPIGLSGAIKILKTTNGNIELASSLYKEQAFEIVKDKITFEIDDKQIQQSLDQCNYDIAKTIEALSELKYSTVERILLRYKDLEQASSRILDVIEKDDNIKRNYWIDLEDTKHLNIPKRCLLIIVEWINYEEWESFCFAIAREDWTKAFINELRNQLKLEELAKHVEEALNISEKFYSENKNASQVPFQYPPLDDLDAYFQKEKPELYRVLIDYVKANIEDFK